MAANASKLVLISGMPGAGKTTLARELAPRLGFALLSKDQIKECLFDAMGAKPGDLEQSRKLGAAAWELLWTVARSIPNLVLEGNFRPASSYEHERLRELSDNPLEIHCRCALELAQRRYAERARGPSRHSAHALSELTLEQLEEFNRPMNIAEVVIVDTTFPVDVDDLAKRVKAKLGHS